MSFDFRVHVIYREWRIINGRGDGLADDRRTYQPTRLGNATADRGTGVVSPFTLGHQTPASTGYYANCTIPFNPRCGKFGCVCCYKCEVDFRLTLGEFTKDCTYFNLNYICGIRKTDEILWKILWTYLCKYILKILQHNFVTYLKWIHKCLYDTTTWNKIPVINPKWFFVI